MAEARGASALDLLTGPDAAGLLTAAVGTAGGELLAVRTTSVDHRPTGSGGGSTTVSYRARVAWPDGERSETLAATTADLPDAPPGVLSLSDGDHRVAVWRFRDDPGLPALAAATDPAALTALLGSFGVAVRGPVRVAVRAYRPRRRAVVEVTALGVRLFLKVLRPSAVAALHARHDVLHTAGVPVPRSLGWSDEGLLLLAPLAGDNLRERMRAGRPMPVAADLVEVLDALPAAVLDLPARPSWTDNVAHYARVLAATCPHEAARAGELAAAVTAGVDGDAPLAPTHGDFYESQLLVEGTSPVRVTGVLDVDTAGPGRRADDLACLVGHAALLAAIEPDHAQTTGPAAARWFRDVVRAGVDEVDLRHRVAGVLVSLATGPHRVQQDDWPSATSARLDLVERWLERHPGDHTE